VKPGLITALVFISSGAFAAQGDEQLIEETYDEWVRVTNTKDIEMWSAFVAPGAVFAPSGAPVLTTMEDIREYYEASFADPNFSLDCEQQRVEIAESGDMAWARGICNFTGTAPDGDLASGTSRWFKVWIRQVDGSWKCKVNTWNLGDN
jgi:ketosteroid isomerase-like protein